MSCSLCGSDIKVQAQTLGESHPIVGTPYHLAYRSASALGFLGGNTVTVELSDETLPATVKSIELEVTVAGRTFRQSFPAEPSQTTTFTWDGRDPYGRLLAGFSHGLVKIGYVYAARYQHTDRFGNNGNGVLMTADSARQEITAWRQIPVVLGRFDVKPLGYGGWTLSAQHAFDPYSGVLLLGTGERRRQEDLLYQVAATAGPAPGAMSLAVAPDGSMVYGTATDVYRITPDGTTVHLAGTGVRGYSGDGGPAIQAMLNEACGVSVGPDGSVYIADRWNNRVRRITPDGLITTVAGNGETSSGQDWRDGWPATEARVWAPNGVLAAPDGTLYVSDKGLARVRKVSPDGLISTVAGIGSCLCGCSGFGYTGDGIPATSAALAEPQQLALDPDGALLIADRSELRVRRVRLDGIIETVAGTGQPGSGGDGGPAIDAQLNFPDGVAVSATGEVLIAELQAHRIRRVTRDGMISTFAGSGVETPVGDGGPGRQAGLSYPGHLGLAGDGTLLVNDSGHGVVRRLAPALACVPPANTLLSSADGSEVYVFDSEGRHFRTMDATTGATLQELGFDEGGLVVSITDAFGNVTTVERDGAGNATAIVAPDGQRTTLTLDAAGYLESITSPAGESTHLVSTSAGLLLSHTDPGGHTSSFTYDAQGLLTRDEDAAGGSLTLARSQTPDRLEVGVTTGEGRVTTYAIEALPDGGESRTTTQAGCSCAGSETVTATDGSVTTSAQDGTVSTTLAGPDPRFGMSAAIPVVSSVATPAGLTSSTTMTRVIEPADPVDPFAITSQTDTITTNGATTTVVYQAASRTITTTSPAGRTTVTTLSPQGLVTSERVATLVPVQYGYDGRGRLTSVTQDARQSTLAYDAQGNLERLTDPLGRSTSFTYDLAGRVLTQTLPGGRLIAFGYDPDGNVTSITPPGRPAHAFGYTAVHLQSAYTPPDVGIGPTATTYAYNRDTQLTGITRPDGQHLGFGYDAIGRLASISSPLGDTILAYDPAKGQLATMITPDGQQLGFSHDGFLETAVQWTGTVSGSIGRAFNNDFRVTQTTVNGSSAVTFTFDTDGLMTKAGGLTLSRHAQNGLVTATTLGVVSDARTYSAYGEPATYTARVSGSPVLDVVYDRDNLGRIDRKTETILGQQTVFEYGYDTAGRLEQVVRTPQGQPAMTTTYAYDSNGNRLSRTDSTGITEGTYDDQDRLLSYGDISYSYTPNGELTSKTQNGASVTYDYDVFGNLRHVTLDSGINIDYVIDARNRRIGKKVNGTLVQGFLWDDQLRVATELDGSGAVVSRFVYATHVNVPEYMVKGGQTYRIVTDHLGSPRLVISTADGSIVQRMDFDEWGVVTLDTNPGFQPFGFAGGLYDTQTKLVRFGARDYDAHVGRWTSKDPIGFDGGDFNLFGYVLDSPMASIDPLGQDAVTDSCSGLKALLQLLRSSGYGARGGYEAMAWLTGGNGCYTAVPMGSPTCTSSGGVLRCTVTSSRPPGTVAMAHTHPTRPSTANPHPATPSGGPGDRPMSIHLRLANYVVSPDGIWRVDANTGGGGEQVAGPEWVGKARTCTTECQ